MAEFILKALVRSRGIEHLYHIESAAVSTEEIGNPIYPPAKRSLSQHGVWFDPWYTGDFEEAFQDILAGCEAMLGSAQAIESLEIPGRRPYPHSGQEVEFVHSPRKSVRYSPVQRSLLYQ